MKTPRIAVTPTKSVVMSTNIESISVETRNHKFSKKISLHIYYFLKLSDIMKTISLLSKDERSLLENSWNKKTKKQFVYYMPRSSEEMSIPRIPSIYQYFIPRMVKEILIFVDMQDVQEVTEVPIAEYIADFIVKLPPYFDNKKLSFEVREWDTHNYLNLDKLAEILTLQRPRLVLEYFSIRGDSENEPQKGYKIFGQGWNYILARSYLVNLRGFYLDLSEHEFEIGRWYQCKIIQLINSTLIPPAIPEGEECPIALTKLWTDSLSSWPANLATLTQITPSLRVELGVHC